MTEPMVDLSSFLKEKYKGKLQTVIQEYVEDVSHGPQNLGLVTESLFMITFDLINQMDKFLDPKELNRVMADFLDETEENLLERLDKAREKYGIKAK